MFYNERTKTKEVLVMLEKEQVSLIEIEKEFEPVIGYKSIKNEMIKICDIMQNHEFYAKLGVSVPNGLLLSGDPGLGKTLMAKCFIKASGRKAFTCRKDKPDGDFVNHIKTTLHFKKGRAYLPFFI